MNNIDIPRIIAEKRLSKRILAEELFPSNKHPVASLDRVIEGDQFLNSVQIGKLSFLTGMPIEDIFSSNFKITEINKKMSFRWGDYHAELNRSNLTTKITHRGSLFHEFVIHKEGITLKSYIEEIKKIIDKHENND